MKITSVTPQSIRRGGSTKEMAAPFGVKEQTPRASYCRFGHWMGMRPVKLPNGRLLWDLDERDQLLSGEVLK